MLSTAAGEEGEEGARARHRILSKVFPKNHLRRHKPQRHLTHLSSKGGQVCRVCRGWLGGAPAEGGSPPPARGRQGPPVDRGMLHQSRQATYQGIQTSVLLRDRRQQDTCKDRIHYRRASDRALEKLLSFKLTMQGKYFPTKTISTSRAVWKTGTRGPSFLADLGEQTL